ncbi:MAG: hypothetical protein JXR94_20760 [Candidatus Hydrogenedentes bacterium]|nr:hypothetical protein [Candidatus Hydrogenedentota bacterium]
MPADSSDTPRYERAPRNLSAAEAYCLDCATRGGVADLQEQFPEDEAARVLRPAFLEWLLTDAEAPVHRRGIRIHHAIIAEPLDLENAVVPHYVELERCRFEKAVSLESGQCESVLRFNHSVFRRRITCEGLHARRQLLCADVVFEKGASFVQMQVGGQLNCTGAHFSAEQESALFDGMTVAGNAYFVKADFRGGADFRGVTVGRQFRCEGSRFAHTQAKANFNGMKVGASAFFVESEFAGPVDFGRARIGSQFGCRKARFASTTHAAIFNGMVVENNVYFGKASFAGPVDFGGAEVGGQFVCREARFASKQEKANFNGMAVGSDAFFVSAEFASRADFTSIKVGRQLACQKARFVSTQGGASFNGMRVGATAFFEKAEFAGQADFSAGKVQEQLDCTETQFNGEGDKADFTGIEIGETGVFFDARFAGPVVFTGAKVGGQLDCREARFTSTEHEAQFGLMEVGNIAFFTNAHFAGPVSVVNADVFDLRLDGQDEESLAPRLSLDRTVVRRELRLNLGRFERVSAESMRVDGTATLTREGTDEADAAWEDEADPHEPLFAFRNSRFGVLDVAALDWGDIERAGRGRARPVLDLDGMTYGRIETGDGRLETGDGRAGVDKALVLLGASVFSPTAYAALEGFYAREGKGEYANDVFVAMKRRARGQVLWPALRDGVRRDAWGAVKGVWCELRGEQPTAAAIRGHVAAGFRGAWRAVRHTLALMWDFFLDGAVRYGRSPARALLLSLVPVAIGWGLFADRDVMVSTAGNSGGHVVASRTPLGTCPPNSPARAATAVGDAARSRQMGASEGEEAGGTPTAAPAAAESPAFYNGLLFSVDAYVPLVDLRMAKAWAPGRECCLRHWYLVFHTMAGWILVPVCLVALTGKIK